MREMELDPPQVLQLHMRGCGNSGTWADVDFPAPHVMYLRRGWKNFARIHSLTAGLVLYFKLMEDGLLSVKVFGDFGTRLKCCVESSSDGDSDDGSSSSSESDEEDSGADDGMSPTRHRTPLAWAGAAAASAPGRSSGRVLPGEGPAP